VRWDKLNINVPGNALSDFDEDTLDAEVPRPAGKDREFGWVDFAVLLIDEREVHTREELDVRSNIGVRWSAGNLKTVDAVLVNCLRDCMGNQRPYIKISRGTYVSWTDNGAVPVAHHDIVAILETVGA